MKTVKKIVSLLIISFLVVASGPTKLNAFTIGEEREVGEKLLYAVRSSFPIIGEPDIHQYINALGAEIIQVAGIQFFDYRFYVVDSNQFNAFAAPSGLIFFYSKLIESMNSEDELVSVLAHEIGHVVKRHLASRMEKGAVVSIASMGLALAAIALGGGGAAAQALLTGSLAAGQSAQLYFSRQDEIEADLLAYKWIKDLHRSSLGQKEMLKTMRRITRYRSGQIPQYLLTHPDPEARLDYVESLISAEQTKPPVDEQLSDFKFLRFKYRIMSIVNENTYTRAYLTNKIANPKSSEINVTMAHYGLALLSRKENNYERSLVELDQVIAKFPQETILQVDRGIILSEMGSLEQAKDTLEKAVKDNPFDMYATYSLATVLDKLNEKEHALQLFYDVSYEMPEYSEVYFQIGKILSDQGKAAASRFYLGKYNLYEGKLKLATSNFKQVSKSKEVSEKLIKESEALLGLIERLMKG